MKLNEIKTDNLFKPINCTYKGIDIFVNGEYVTLKYKNKFIDSFVCHYNNIKELKTLLKMNVNRHDIKALCKMPYNEIKTFLKASEIERLNSYFNLKHEKPIAKANKELNKYLLNEIKEYFIFRLVNGD